MYVVTALLRGGVRCEDYSARERVVREVGTNTGTKAYNTPVVSIKTMDTGIAAAREQHFC